MSLKVSFPKLTYPVNRTLSILFLGAGFGLAALMSVAFFHGFPLPPYTEIFFKVKSLRKFFEGAFIFLALGIFFHPKRRDIFQGLQEWLRRMASSRRAIWILCGAYFLLFFWQQATKYLALEINFIPFLYYDYMFWYLEQGKLFYTGLLHGFYHGNAILGLLYPIWKVVRSPWLLHMAAPLIAASAAIPFFYWSQSRLKSFALALVAAFVFLNFRFLQNVLLVNFAVEVFYPLLIFTAIYALSNRREWLYWTSVVLGLMVKEDASIYFGGLGIFCLCLPGHRKRGLGTILFSLLYAALLLKIVMPWAGASKLLTGNIENYPALGSSFGEMVRNVCQKPWIVVRELFYPWMKVETLWKLTSRLLFLPFVSPWIFLVFASCLPPFFQSAERPDYFHQLSFYYGAAVLPFLFVAFVDGWARFRQARPFKNRRGLQAGAVLLLLFLNGMNFRPLHFTKDDLKSIKLAKSLSKEAVVTTQGHLLPYVGYRRWNFFISEQYELRTDTREAYLNPDYYLFDFDANPYPLTREDLLKKADILKSDSQWEVIYQDHRRLLLRQSKGEEK